jgi:hypothetical protein
MIRLGAFLLGSVLLIGCDSEHVDAAQGLSSRKSVHEVSITDLRPARQKLDQTLSVNLTDCQYGSYQLADHYRTPGRVAILTHYLSNELPKAYQGMAFDLHNFTIHINNLAQLVDLSSDDQDGTGLDDFVVGCSQDDLMGGYNLAEVANALPPLIAVADLAVGDKVFHVRVIRSPDAQFWAHKNARWDALMNELVLAIGAQLVAEITTEPTI